MKHYVCQSRKQCRREDREYADTCGWSTPSNWVCIDPFWCAGVEATVIIEEYRGSRSAKTMKRKVKR